MIFSKFFRFSFYQEKKSFLFSLNHKQKLKCIDEEDAVTHLESRFPTFGLVQYSKSDLVFDLSGFEVSYLNLETCYELSEGIDFFEGKSFFEGLVFKLV